MFFVKEIIYVTIIYLTAKICKVKLHADVIDPARIIQPLSVSDRLHLNFQGILNEETKVSEIKRLILFGLS